ncbi:hypothetical protein FRX31_008858 [Thalictrum thalictroides]|uniref:Uncharacterized protein n=1 Tax=Thalictrum thalictroides TaxID=46969 RepID=A0A7J6WYB7_THATH|nr:hypothetical protein FRX31_008858 [Thalictrum thalictroides]
MYGDSTTNGTPVFKLIITDVKLRFAGLQHCFKNTTTNIEAASILGRQDLIKCVQLKAFRWKPPSEGWHILNEDRAGYGGLIRDSSGNTHSFCCRSYY